MSEFVTVCRADAIEEGSASVFPVGDTLVAIFRENGEFFAINDFCPHMGASLAEGCFEDGYVTCPWHAWAFSVRSGELCDNPAIKTDRFPVRVQDEQVQVQINPPKIAEDDASI